MPCGESAKTPRHPLRVVCFNVSKQLSNPHRRHEEATDGPPVGPQGLSRRLPSPGPLLREAVVDAVSFLPPAMAVFLLAAVPIVELRGAIPVAILVYGMSVPEAVLWSILGNIFPVVFLLMWLAPVEQFLRRKSPWFDRFFTRLFDRTVRKLDDHVKRYEALALTLFVMVPLPVTGAWTGSAAAHVFQLGFWRSLAAIVVGVCLAAGIVTALVTSGQALWLLGG